MPNGRSPLPMSGLGIACHPHEKTFLTPFFSHLQIVLCTRFGQRLNKLGIFTLVSTTILRLSRPSHISLIILMMQQAMHRLYNHRQVVLPLW